MPPILTGKVDRENNAVELYLSEPLCCDLLTSTRTPLQSVNELVWKVETVSQRELKIEHVNIMHIFNK